MPERPGGFESKEIDDGFRALASVQGEADIGRLIDKMPVLRSAIFHAQLRQYRLTNLAEFEAQPRAYQGFMQVYDAFFTRLHFLANYEQSRSEAEPQRTSAELSRRETPPFFEALRSALGSAVPAPDGPTSHPRYDTAGIAATISRLTKKSAELPPWEPTPGTLWSCAVVACGRCHELRLVISPYYLDLVERPDLLDLLRSGAYESSVCPHCSARAIIPLRTWIAEEPRPHDSLGAVCVLCRVRDTEIIYRPPPGTVRREQDDRILEVRLDMMVRQLKIEQPFVEGVVLSNGIAYSLEELVARIDRTQSTAVSIGYQDTMAAIYQKLLSGLLNWQDAERLVHDTVAASGLDWPIAPAHPAGDLMKALIMNLVAEGCAEVQGKPAGFRAALSELVAQCYIGIGEIARARIALARARDLAATLAEDTSTEAGLKEIEYQILRAEGRHEEAARIRPLQEKPSGDDPASRLRRAEMLQNEGLDLRRAGHIRDAMQALGDGLSLLRTLVAENDSDDVRNALSGTLANLASVYSDCSGNIETLAWLSAKPIVHEELPKKVRERLQRLGSPEALLSMQKEMYGPVREVLNAEFGREPNAADLRARAIALNREAISQCRDSEYLCIQCRALAGLLLEEGDFPGATVAARDCLGHAARTRDYRYMATASWQLAEIASAEGDAPSAMGALEQCMTASLRQTVRAGSPATDALAVGCEALRVAEKGGDLPTGILLAESAKAISTSVSLVRAVPLQGEKNGPLTDLYQQRETLRLRSMWEPGASLSNQVAALEAKIEHARRELAVRDPRASSWHDATYLDISRPVPIRRLLTELGRGTTYAGFVIEGKKLFAYALSPEDQILEQEDLPEEVPLCNDLEKLASLLLQPLASRLEKLKPEDRLIISQCPELEAVPFALLPFQGQPLFTRATVSVVNGSGMFEASARRPFLALHSAVLVGAPARPDVPDLPKATAEVEDIAAKLESVGVRVRPALTGVAATVPALVARAQNADLIHFACHGEIARNEQKSRLLLAPSPLTKDSGVLSEDRILTDLKLKPGCHVNLAACRSAISGGEGEYHARGLVAALLVAGASSVLATLWPLRDGPTAVFQAAYYDSIARGRSPALALAATQRAAAKGELGEELRLTENFGGYVLYGLAPEAHASDARA
jgi:CHAT domain